MKGYIYKYTFPDGKLYIGQTLRPLAARHREHIMPSSGKANVGFWEAWQKFGKADLEPIETIEDDDLGRLNARLNFLEYLYIKELQATNPEFGYNRIPGGHATNPLKKIVDQVYRKIWPDIWGEREMFYQNLLSRLRDDNIQWPIKLSDEEARLIREAVFPIIEFRDYIELTDDNMLSIIGLGDDEEGDESEEDGGDGWDEFVVDEALSWLLFGVDEVYQEELTSTARMVENYIIDNYETFANQDKILKIDKYGVVVKEYNNIKEIMHDLTLHYTANIYNVLEGKQKTAYGYIWRWKREYEDPQALVHSNTDSDAGNLFANQDFE